MSGNPLVSVCIACYKGDPLIRDAQKSIYSQTYKNIEVRTFIDNEGIGTGAAFNMAIKMAKGEIVVLLCSDDIFADDNVISDMVRIFNTRPNVGHVSRGYFQFVEGDLTPVRAWRNKDILELANNPSGLAFRKDALDNTLGLSNKMFVEVAWPVKQILSDGWDYEILPYDSVAVRIHKSISRTPGYYKKMWTSSPVEEWAMLGWKTTDYTHLIQVGVNFEKKAVAQEAAQFLNVNEWAMFNPVFWFFFVVALWTPRPILYKIPEIYRATWGRLTTRKVCRQR